MLERARGLSDDVLAALAGLEQRVVTVDGGRLKLEWATLRSRPGDRVDDLLWTADGMLQGFLGLYSFGGGPVELVGMVDPAARRRGIGTALLDAALELCRDRQAPQVLLVVPRGSSAGRSLALARGAQLEHSEHALVLLGPVGDAPAVPGLVLRPAGPADVAPVGRLLEDAFGHPFTGLADRLLDPDEPTLVAELHGATVGTVRLTLDGADGGVYGLAVDPERQGRGIGRAVLAEGCRALRERGAQRVGLEVASDNDRALGLYTSVGFAPVATEDYYRLPNG